MQIKPGKLNWYAANAPLSWVVNEILKFLIEVILDESPHKPTDPNQIIIRMTEM